MPYLFMFSVLASLIGGAVYGERIKVSCPGKDPIYFTVEVMRTSEQRQKGLMFRTDLPLNAGMHFLFEENSSHPPTMWMKNTSLPLDMMFADQKGQILEIFAHTCPHSTALIGPVPGTSQILEVNAGRCQHHGITKGCFLQLVN